MKTLLLLHGAMGSKEQLQPLLEKFSDQYKVYSINFSGHGGTNIPEEISIKLFAGEVLSLIEKNKLEKVNIFGYSMGGYVALYLALHHPGLVDSVMTLGTKLHWDEPTAAKEVAMLQPEVIAQKVPKFAEQLAQRHHPADWKLLMIRTGTMLQQMGKQNPVNAEDFSKVICKVLLMLGDRDKMVTLDETVAVFRQLQKAQLAVLPNTPHAIEQVDVDLVVHLTQKFLL